MENVDLSANELKERLTLMGVNIKKIQEKDYLLTYNQCITQNQYASKIKHLLNNENNTIILKRKRGRPKNPKTNEHSNINSTNYTIVQQSNLESNKNKAYSNLTQKEFLARIEQEIEKNQKIINKESINILDELAFNNINNEKHIQSGNNFTLGKSKIIINRVCLNSNNHSLSSNLRVENDTEEKKNQTENLFKKLNLDDISLKEELPYHNYSNKYNDIFEIKHNIKYPSLSYYNRNSSLSKQSNILIKTDESLENIIIKSGVSITILSGLAYFLYKRSLSDENGISLIFEDLLKSLNNNKILVFEVLILISFSLLFYILYIQNQYNDYAKEDYLSLLELSSKDEFPNKDDFYLSEKEVISKFAKRHNMTNYSYSSNVLLRLRSIIEEKNVMYFHCYGEDKYLRIK